MFPPEKQKKIPKLDAEGNPDPTQWKRWSYSLKPGFVYNPFNKWPRNKPCPVCESGKKFKKCCMNQVHRAVPEKLGRQLQEKYNQKIKEIE